MRNKLSILMLSMLPLYAAVSTPGAFAQAATDTNPVAPTGKIYELRSGVTPPKLFRQDPEKEPCDPVGISKVRTGTVMLSFVVTEAGDVVQVKVEKAPSTEMAACAVQAVQRSHFTPALRKKSPVAVHMILSMNFEAK